MSPIKSFKEYLRAIYIRKDGSLNKKQILLSVGFYAFVTAAFALMCWALGPAYTLAWVIIFTLFYVFGMML